MDKARLLKALTEMLREELALLARAADDARSGATDSEVKSESKYDTRGLESSYLARGHAMKFEALADDVGTLENLEYRDYDDSEPIALGAVVDVKIGRYVSRFFLLPCGGGAEIELEDMTDEVTVITPESPMGQQLMGAHKGDSFILATNKMKAVVQGFF